MRFLAVSPLASPIAAFMMTIPAQAQAVQIEIELPATEILQAARTIVPQEGPAYKVNGELTCWSYAREFPPYGSLDGCELTIDKKKASFTPSRDLLNRMMKAVSASGPYLDAKLPVQAESVTQEFPPYLVFERAIAILK